jgi:hypothetical protein
MKYTYDQRDYFVRYCYDQKLEDLWRFKEGDTLIVVDFRNTPYAQFSHVTVVKGTEEGIFETRPFVTVTDGENRMCMHASRFIPADNRIEKPL